MKKNSLFLAVFSFAIFCNLVLISQAISMDIEKVKWTDLNGQDKEDWPLMLSMMRRQCIQLKKIPSSVSLGGDLSLPSGDRIEDWRGVCKALPLQAKPAQIHTFFYKWFQPYRLRNKVTYSGYYEPQIQASFAPDLDVNVPIYRKPSDLKEKKIDNKILIGKDHNNNFIAYDTRHQIDQGSLSNKKLAIAWVKNYGDLFSAQTEGAAQLIFRDGQTINIVHDGSNGHPYVSLGSILRKKNYISNGDEISTGSIEKWLDENPEHAEKIFKYNPNYIFFKTISVPQGKGHPGSLGIPLTPYHSLAVDKKMIPLGTLIWAETLMPKANNSAEVWQHLVFAQDSGGGLEGDDKADIFLGSDHYISWIADHLHNKGRMFLLLPRKNIK